MLQRILITGANRGIGYGIAENLAAKGGYQLILACRDTQKSAKVKQYLNDTFPQSKIHTVKLDLRDNRSIEDLVSEMKAKGDNIDVLINNAGVACAMNDTKPESAR